MKKCIAILFLILAAAGTFYPCCLDDDCAGELAQTEDHFPGKEETDSFCSPFSACASCAASVDITTGNFVVQLSEPLIAHYSPYLVANIEEVYSSLFQPPRFC